MSVSPWTAVIDNIDVYPVLARVLGRGLHSSAFQLT